MKTIKEFTEMLLKEYNIKITRQAVVNQLNNPKKNLEVVKYPKQTLLPESTQKKLTDYYKFKYFYGV
jgi:hypothetical protein